MARTIDSDRKHLTAVLSAAAAHRGTSFVEIYQNCPIFNDGAFDAIKGADTKADAIIPLVHGEPIRFGVRKRRQGADPRHRDRRRQGRAGRRRRRGRRCSSTTPTTPTRRMAFAISRLTDSGYLNQSPIGIFRQVERATYDDLARAQVATAREAVDRQPDRAARRPDQRRRHLDRRLTAPRLQTTTAPTELGGGRRRRRW